MPDLGAVPAADATDEQVSAQRLREEEAAGQTLQNLEGMDPTSLSFRQQLELLQEAVGRHAEAERMVLQARLAAGWITEDDLAREEAALEALEGAEEDA